ncbi:5'-3' exonuclease H3TH domain-containing protein [Brevibacterium litoralis]|uniref:5'-3' exonuclease H3TH domain-containing protein n=1 Tax=Brevibacterium litoralis TaxID=3138935 RepID=UPI0032ECD85E
MNSAANTTPLVVLDTPALYYRSFYAMPENMTDPQGMPIGAVRGLVDSVAALVEDLGSARVVACMDADWRPAFRTALVPEYKAQRVTDAERGIETPPALEPQVPVLTRLLELAGIPIGSIEGTEADDVIASLVVAGVAAGVPVAVVSPDRDLLALLRDGADVRLHRPRPKGQWETTRVEDLAGLYGVPDGTTYRMLAALRGDPSDGLPGAPGIGEKTAAKLLAGYGTLEGILAAAGAGQKEHGLSPKRRESILAHADAVRATFEVMRCKEDLPVADLMAAADRVADRRDPGALADLAHHHAVDRSVQRLLTALDAVGGGAPAGGADSGGAAAGGSAGPAGAAGAEVQAALPIDTPAVSTAVAGPAASSGTAEASGEGAPWSTGPFYGFDLETTGVDTRTARIVSAALVPFGPVPAATGGARPDPMLRVPLEPREWLLDPGVPIPEAAIAVHGITNERVRAEGQDPATGVASILDALAAVAAEGGVIVGHNVVYDLTILQAESLRTGQTAPDGTPRTAKEVVGAVVDTFVLDKQVEKYRRGKRDLTTLTAVWGVALDDAHDATADARAAALMALRIARAHPEVGGLDARAVHAAQIDWKAAQAADFRAYLQRKGRSGNDVSGDWPFER